jgi:hypothetical protein
MTDPIAVTQPKITYGITQNVFEWDNLHLIVNVDRITDDCHAELSFYYNNGDGKKLLHMGQANLLSSTFQREFIKSLETRGMNLDWQTILGYISLNTVQHQREGEPVVDLTEAYGKARPQYILPPLFVKDAPNIIYADRSSAKSLFMVLIDLSLSMPWWDNDIGLVIGQEKHNVLYCDWESSAQIIGWQKECLRKGMPRATNCDVPYLHCSGSLSDNIYHIQQKIQNLKADIIIIDSLGMAVGDDLNLTKPAFAFYAALRQLPVTPIIIGHTAKNMGEQRKKTVYGNAYYENEARSVWEISKNQAPMSSELTITLFQRKPPPFSPIHEPIAFRFIFDGDIILTEKAQPILDKSNGGDEPPTQAEVILATLDDRGEPLSPTELAIITSIEAGNVRTVLMRLKNQGKVTKVKDKYTIPNNDDKPLL